MIEIDYSKYFRASDANKMLGYAGRSGVANLCRMQLVPGAVLAGQRTWLVPRVWVYKQQALAAQNINNKRMPGRPRGSKNIAKN